MEKLILIKLGGSIITDKGRPFTAKENVIRRLGLEILEAKKRLKCNLIIGHGSGSFGHSVATKYKTQEGYLGERSLKGLSFVSDAAIRINRIVISNFLKVGMAVISFSPASFIFSKKQNTQAALVEPMVEALKIGAIPVVYGDIVFDKMAGFCIYSSEKTLNLLASKLKDRYKSIRIIYCGDTDGVYDGEGKTISRISSKNYNKYKKDILGSKEEDVTGGMLHKVEESLKIAKSQGIKTWIINGNKVGNLKKAILGELSIKTTVIS